MNITCEVTIQTRVRFLLHEGRPGKTEECRDIPSRDPQLVVQGDIPHDAYAFQFYAIVTANADIVGKMAKLRDPEFDASDFFFLGGTVYTAEQFAAMDPSRVYNHAWYLSQIRQLGWKKVIITRLETVEPFAHGDEVVL